MNEEIYNKIKDFMLDKKGTEKIKVTFENNAEDILRIAHKSITGELMVYAKRSKRKGYYLNYYLRRSSQIIDFKPIIPGKKDLNASWNKQVDKVIKMLEISGLWDNILRDFKIAKEIGFEKFKIADSLVFKDYEGLNYEEKEKKRNESIKEIDLRFMAKREDGSEYVNSGFIFMFSGIPKIEKMTFGKGIGLNEHYFNIAEEMLKNKKKDSFNTYGNYDYSFEFDGISKAWYSKEFKGCGNGHYYLALSNKYALFYEDD